MRTNIDIDDALMARALEVTGLSSKRAVVEEGLKLLARVHDQKEFLDLGGTIPWEGDLAASREGRCFEVEEPAA